VHFVGQIDWLRPTAALGRLVKSVAIFTFHFFLFKSFILQKICTRLAYFRILHVCSLPVARDLTEEAAAGDSSVVLEEFANRQLFCSASGTAEALGRDDVCCCGGPGT